MGVVILLYCTDEVVRYRGILAPCEGIIQK